jgi:predicted metal-binding protein
MEAKVCTHPTMMRFPEHAVGINMIKTAERAGTTLKFPVKGKPVPTALLLID